MLFYYFAIGGGMKMDSKLGVMDFSTLNSAWECAQLIAGAEELCPYAYRDKPKKVLCAIQYGMEIGLSPMQSVWWVRIFNGVPSVPGEALLALCLASGKLENIQTISNEDNTAVTVTMKRKGMDEMTVTYTQEDAKRAGLWGKMVKRKSDGQMIPSPWVTDPVAMMTWRAQGKIMKHRFSDILKGIVTQEEAQDYEEFDNNGEILAKDKKKPLIQPKPLPLPKNVPSKGFEAKDDGYNPPVGLPAMLNILPGSNVSVPVTQVTARKNATKAPSLGEEYYKNYVDEAGSGEVQKAANVEEKGSKLYGELLRLINYWNIQPRTIERWKANSNVTDLKDLSEDTMHGLIDKLYHLDEIRKSAAQGA
jgi:hypothetical protein